MSTIYEKLRYLFDTKKLIKESIEKKGVSIPNDTPFRDYADKILKINDETTLPDQEGGIDASGTKIKTVTVNPTGKEYVITTSDENVDYFSAVTVKGDANLIPENIRKGTKIYGVYGEYYPTVIDDTRLVPLGITPERNGKVHFPKDYSADGFATVTVEGCADLKPINIRQGTTIFGVTGTFQGGTESGYVISTSLQLFDYLKMNAIFVDGVRRTYLKIQNE